MFEDSSGLGERQARAVIVLVLLVETLWVAFHKFLPFDAALWTLQSDVVRQHIAGNAADGLSLIKFPAANILAPLVSGLLSFLMDAEIVTRLLIAVIGIFGRGIAMLSLLRVLRVRDDAVYYLIPVFCWSGILWSGSVPYLLGETAALFFASYLLKQDRPSQRVFMILLVSSAIVAMFHALAFVCCAILVLYVANEQRRSVHISQGWLSNMSSVASIILPGCGILLLRVFDLAPIFSFSTSGFLGTGGWSHLIFTATVSPLISEVAFPSFNLICIGLTVFVILLVAVAYIRAFLLPMEEVSWQSRSAKATGTTLLLIALLSPLLSLIGIQSSAFLWCAAFLALAGSYSRGPAVRRSAIDKLLNVLGFIAMVAVGGLNGFSTNQGSEAAYDLRQDISKQISSSGLQPEHQVNGLKTRSTEFYYVIDNILFSKIHEDLIGSASYTLSVPLYLFGAGNSIGTPWVYQPEGGIVKINDEATNTLGSPLKPLDLQPPQRNLDPAIRMIAALPNGTASSEVFGKYAHSLIDTTGIIVDKGTLKYQMLIGSLSSLKPSGLALK